MPETRTENSKWKAWIKSVAESHGIWMLLNFKWQLRGKELLSWPVSFKMSIWTTAKYTLVWICEFLVVMFILWLHSDTLEPSKSSVPITFLRVQFHAFYYYTFLSVQLIITKCLPHRDEQISLKFHCSSKPSLKMLNWAGRKHTLCVLLTIILDHWWSKYCWIL
jgi:hypothetical protein